MESLTEMSDVVQICERELVLYKDAKVQDLVGRLYVQLFEALDAWRNFYSHSGSSRMHHLLKIRPDTEILTPEIEKSMAEIRRLSQAVLREVDYRHRVELRETSSKVADIQIQQRKILTTLEDQRRILKSLQEERRIISVVQEQQKILQIVQQIQGAMQMRGTGEQAGS